MGIYIQIQSSFLAKCRNIMGLILVSTCFLSGQTWVSENFNHNDQDESEENCWQFINARLNSREFEGDIDGTITSCELRSPFINFNGTGDIHFKHQLDGNPPNLSMSYLNIYLRDPAGNLTGPIFTHIYQQFFSSPNGPPQQPHNENIPITWTGYYQVVWAWTGFLNNQDAILDNILIKGDFAADDSEETNGYCPAMMEEQDTVCAGELNDRVSTLYPRSGRDYDWNFVGPNGGNIDETVTSDDRSVEVDWTSVVGDYVLFVKESSAGGLPGNEVSFNVHVLSQPSFTVDLDTTCEGTQAICNFTFSGVGPFSLTYFTNFTSQTINVAGTTTSVTLPLTATYINITNVSDASGCAVDPTTLGSHNLYYTDPVTGAIFHY